MKKTIEIKDDKTLELLQIKAIKARTNLKDYIEKLLVKHSKEK